MNHSATKLLIISLGLFVVAVGVAASIILIQESEGEDIRDSLVRFKTWEELRQAGLSDNGVDGQVYVEEEINNLILASESDTVKFLSFVDEVALKTNVSIIATGLKVDKTREVGFDDLSASFSVKGERLAVEKVIRLFELLPYRSAMSSLSLSRLDGGGAEASFLLSISVKE